MFANFGAIVLTVTRTLVLWRHAKSAWDDTILADFDRPLNARGQRAAPAMAKFIAEYWPPQAVICSPAKRTVQTLEHLAFRLADSVPISFDERVYGAPWPQLREVVAKMPPTAKAILLIGHNPGLEDLTAALAEPPPQKFATATVAALQFEGEWEALGPGTARLAAFQRPNPLSRHSP